MYPLSQSQYLHPGSREPRARSRSSQARRARRGRSAQRVQELAHSLRPQSSVRLDTVPPMLFRPDPPPPAFRDRNQRQVKIAHTTIGESLARLGRDLRETRLGQNDLTRAWALLDSWWPPTGSREHQEWATTLRDMDMLFNTMSVRLVRLEQDLALGTQDLQRAQDLIHQG